MRNFLSNYFVFSFICNLCAIFFSHVYVYAIVCTEIKMWNVTKSSARSIYGTILNEWKIANNAGKIRQLNDIKKKIYTNNIDIVWKFSDIFMHTWIKTKTKKIQRRLEANASRMNDCDTENCMCVATMSMTTSVAWNAGNKLTQLTTTTTKIAWMALGKLDSHT